MAARVAFTSRLPGVVHTLLGLVLLTAAGLKLAGTNVSPFAQYGWFSAPWVQTLAVEWEIVLGLWLLSGAYRAGAWLAAVGTFAAFAAVSGYLGWIGQASCGCFGMVEASPWHAFAVDVTALVLLAVARPDWRAVRETPRADLLRRPTGFAGVLLGAAVILVTLTGAATWAYGSPTAALARLHGPPCTPPGTSISEPADRVTCYSGKFKSRTGRSSRSDLSVALRTARASPQQICLFRSRPTERLKFASKSKSPRRPASAC